MKRLYTICVVCTFLFSLALVAGCSDAGGPIVSDDLGTADTTSVTDTSTADTGAGGEESSPTTTPSTTTTTTTAAAGSTTPTQPAAPPIKKDYIKHYTISAPLPINVGKSSCSLSCKGGAIAGFAWEESQGGWLKTLAVHCSACVMDSNGITTLGPPQTTGVYCGKAQDDPNYYNQYSFPAMAVATGIIYTAGARLDSITPLFQRISELTGSTLTGTPATPMGTALQTTRIGGTGGNATKSISCPPRSFLTEITVVTDSEIHDIKSVTCLTIE